MCPDASGSARNGLSQRQRRADQTTNHHQLPRQTGDEICGLAAQTAKTEAETAKLQAEQKASRRRFGSAIVEGLKVIGALIVGAGGLMAAVTGYQLTEVRKEKMELQVEKLGNELRQKTEELTTAESKKKTLDSAVKTAQEQFDSTQAELEQLKGQLVALKGNVTSESNAQVLDSVITRTTQIRDAVGAADTQLRSATVELAKAAAGGEWQVLIGDYADEAEGMLKQKAAERLGINTGEFFGTLPHRHLRFRFPTKEEALRAAEKLKAAKISHEPEVQPYRPRP